MKSVCISFHHSWRCPSNRDLCSRVSSLCCFCGPKVGRDFWFACFARDDHNCLGVSHAEVDCSLIGRISDATAAEYRSLLQIMKNLTLSAGRFLFLLTFVSFWLVPSLRAQANLWTFEPFDGVFPHPFAACPSCGTIPGGGSPPQTHVAHAINGYTGTTPRICQVPGKS